MKTIIKKIDWLTLSDGTGWGNGYVSIPKGHPLHGKHYDDIDVSVHGGLTFSSLVSECKWPELKNIDKNDWLIGFDTCHWGDNPSNWPKERVQEEADNLLNQIKNIK